MRHMRMRFTVMIAWIGDWLVKFIDMGIDSGILSDIWEVEMMDLICFGRDKGSGMVNGRMLGS